MADTRNFANGSVNKAASEQKYYMEEVYADCSSIARGAADIDQLFDLLQGMLVLAVAMEVVTAEGGTCTIDVGITGTDVDAWLDGVDGNAAAGTMYCSNQIPTFSTTNANLVHPDTDEVYGIVGGYFHGSATADTADALYNNASDAGVFRYSMAFINMKSLLSFQQAAIA